MTDASNRPRDFFALAIDAATKVKNILYPPENEKPVSRKHNRAQQRNPTQQSSSQPVAVTSSSRVATTTRKPGSTYSSIHRPDGSKTVWENGRVKTYDPKGKLVTDLADVDDDIWYSSTDRRNGYHAGTFDERGRYVGGSAALYGGYDSDYPKWDSTKTPEENRKILADHREKKDKERKREKLRRKKDSPTLLADVVKELKIENKDKLEPGQELKMHLEWQKYLAYFRSARVPRIKAIIQRMNTSQGKEVCRLCDSCAGSLLIPMTRENGLICGAADCASCNGAGYQVPAIHVG